MIIWLTIVNFVNIGLFILVLIQLAKSQTITLEERKEIERKTQEYIDMKGNTYGEVYQTNRRISKYYGSDQEIRGDSGQA